MHTKHLAHEDPGCAYTLSRALILTALIGVAAAGVISHTGASKLQEHSILPQEE